MIIETGFLCSLEVPEADYWQGSYLTIAADLLWVLEVGYQQGQDGIILPIFPYSPISQPAGF